MCTIKFEELEFDHMVEFIKDSTVFLSGRESGSGKVRLFLIHEDTGNVYTRNGRVDSWEELEGNFRDAVVSRLYAFRDRIPVYRVNGTHEVHA